MRGRFDGGVAVPAVHTEIPGMELVAVGDRLPRRITRFNSLRVQQIHAQSGGDRAPD